MNSILWSIIAIETALLIGLGFGIWFRRNNYAGVIKIYDSPTGRRFSLELDRDPEELEFLDEVKFKIEALE